MLNVIFTFKENLFVFKIGACKQGNRTQWGESDLLKDIHSKKAEEKCASII